MDKGHGNLSGPATKRILEREYSEYNWRAFPCADLPVPQLRGVPQTEHQLSAVIRTVFPDGSGIYLAVAESQFKDNFPPGLHHPMNHTLDLYPLTILLAG